MEKIITVLLWCALIFFLSSQSQLPGPADDFADFIVKKLSHMFVYGVLFLLVVRAQKNTRRKTIFYSFLFVFFYACSDEFHQSFVPGRSPALRDVGFDMVGALVARACSRHFEISA